VCLLLLWKLVIMRVVTITVLQKVPVVSHKQRHATLIQCNDCFITSIGS
jgi:hypothetical protein